MNIARFTLILTVLMLPAGPSAWGQTHFGVPNQNRSRQGQQLWEGQIRNGIQHEIQRRLPQIKPPHQGGGQQILPYPPLPSPRLPGPIVKPGVPGTSPTCPVRPLPHPPGTIVKPLPSPIVKPTPLPIIHPEPNPTCTIPPTIQPLPQPTPQPTPGPQPTPEPPTPETGPTQPELPVVASGQRLVLDGPGFGDEPGAVFLQIGELVLNADILSWSDASVHVTLPVLPMAIATEALVAVMTATEEIVARMDVQLVPAEESEDEATDEDPDILDADESDLPKITLGTELTLEGEELGTATGTVQVVIGNLQLNAKVLEWSPADAIIRLPALDLADPVAGSIRIFDAQHKLASETQVLFVNETMTSNVAPE